jgi:hypothetical protein
MGQDACVGGMVRYTAKSKWRADGIDWLPLPSRFWSGRIDWLVERFTLLGVMFQIWMIVALASVLVGALLAWWRQR